jgi:hypothetical protein
MGSKSARERKTTSSSVGEGSYLFLWQSERKSLAHYLGVEDDVGATECVGVEAGVCVGAGVVVEAGVRVGAGVFVYAGV